MGSDVVYCGIDAGNETTPQIGCHVALIPGSGFMEDPMFFGSMTINGDHPGSQYGGYGGIGTYTDRSVYVNGWKIGRNCDGDDVDIEDLCNGCFCGTSIRQKIYGWEMRETASEQVVSKTELRGTRCQDVHPADWCEYMNVGEDPEGNQRGPPYQFAPFWIDIFRGVNDPFVTFFLNCTWAMGGSDCENDPVWEAAHSGVDQLSPDGYVGDWSRTFNTIWTFETEDMETGNTVTTKHKDATGGTSDVIMEYELVIASKGGVSMPGSRKGLCVNLESTPVGDTCPLDNECPRFKLFNGPVTSDDSSGAGNYIWEEVQRKLDSTTNETASGDDDTVNSTVLDSVLMHKSTITIKNSNELWQNGGDELCLNLGLHPSLGEWGATSITGDGYGARIFQNNLNSGFWFNGDLSATILTKDEQFKNFSFQAELKNEWYDYAGKLPASGIIDSMVYSNIGKFCSPKTNKVEMLKLRLDMDSPTDDETPWMLKACFPKSHYVNEDGEAIDTWIVLDPITVSSNDNIMDTATDVEEDKKPSAAFAANSDVASFIMTVVIGVVWLSFIL